MSEIRKTITEADIKRIPRGKVLVRRSAVQEVSEGGIVLPENKAEKPLACEVLMIGADRYKTNGKVEPCIFAKPAVNVGDVVSVRQYHGKSINLDKELSIVDGRDIEGVLTIVDNESELTSAPI